MRITEDSVWKADTLEPEHLCYPSVSRSRQRPILCENQTTCNMGASYSKLVELFEASSSYEKLEALVETFSESDMKRLHRMNEGQILAQYNYYRNKHTELTTNQLLHFVRLSNKYDFEDILVVVYTHIDTMSLLNYLTHLKYRFRRHDIVEAVLLTLKGVLKSDFHYVLKSHLEKYMRLWTPDMSQLDYDILYGVQNDVIKICQVMMKMNYSLYSSLRKVYTDVLKELRNPEHRKGFAKLHVIFDTRWGVIKSFIKSTPLPQDYVWENICKRFSISQNDMDTLRRLVSIYSDTKQDINKMSKQQLCQEVNKIPSIIINEGAQRECSGDNIFDPITWDEIPKYRRILIGKHCFDVESLGKQIQSGDSLNPITREELPVEDINILRQIIHPIHNIQRTRYNDIIDTPVLTEKEQMKQRILNIWEHIPNPPPVELLMDATYEQLYHLLHELIEHQIFSPQDKFAYPSDRPVAHRLRYIVDLLEQKFMTDPLRYSVGTLVSLNAVFRPPQMGGHSGVCS